MTTPRERRMKDAERHGNFSFLWPHATKIEELGDVVMFSSRDAIPEYCYPLISKNDKLYLETNRHFGRAVSSALGGKIGRFILTVWDDDLTLITALDPTGLNYRHITLLEPI